MPPRRRTTAGPPPLTESDLEWLRSKVQAGEKPRVVVRAASTAVAAGTRGNVVRFGDPKDNEYVVVRLGKDEVPFAPAELAMTGKSASRPSAAANPEPALPLRVPANRRSATRPTSQSRRTAKRAVPPLVVTMRFRDGNWSVEAQRGARRLAKATPLRPGAVSAFAEHVDDDTIRDALTETVESCRAVVAEQAAALRAQLHAAEELLLDYEAKPTRRTSR